MSSNSFTLNGRHVLAMLVAFFAVVIVANAIFIALALKSFPGEQEKKSYLQGLRFNERIADRKAQDALGWSVEIATPRGGDGLVSIDLVFLSATDTPIGGLAIDGLLSRPASEEFDAALVFEEIAAGAYRARIAAPPGVWRLQATARNERGDAFALEKRLTLE